MIALALVAGVLATAPADSARPAKCSYVVKAMRQEADPGLAPRGTCGHLDAAGVLHVEVSRLRNLDRDARGVGAVHVEGVGWFLVATGGRTARVPTWDNGPEGFAEGLARTLVDGRIGYVDTALELAIPPRFDFGWPFEDGRARVCVGCVLSAPDDDGHRTVDGGRWGFIDRAGREVVPIRFSREELDREPTATAASAPVVATAAGEEGEGLVAPPAPTDVLAVARRLMTAARYAALVTIGEDGRAESRIVDPFPPEDDMTVWVATRPVTRKVEQIRRDPRVTLFWWDPARIGYVTLLGDATLVDDPAEKARRWKPEWQDFYADANHGADYLLIRVRPRRLEILSVGDGVLNDPATWRPVQHVFP